jgi:hypothetical protein
VQYSGQACASSDHQITRDRPITAIYDPLPIVTESVQSRLRVVDPLRKGLFRHDFGKVSG